MVRCGCFEPMGKDYLCGDDNPEHSCVSAPYSSSSSTDGLSVHNFIRGSALCCILHGGFHFVTVTIDCST